MSDFATVLDRISQADDVQISDVIKAVIRRYRQVHPAQEVVFLSLPVETSEERDRCIDAALTLLRKRD